MLKSFRDKMAFSGIVVLMLGVALLIFTFISAYGFLTQSLSIIAAEDLTRAFGEAFAPLIATCIRVMYLGVMGWVGSLLTMRGVTIINNSLHASAIAQQKQTTTEQKPKEESKPPEQKIEGK